MMTNLFSIFDPTSEFSSPYMTHWVTFFFFLFFIPSSFYMISSREMLIFEKLINFSLEASLGMLNMKKNLHLVIITVPMFLFIVFVNLVSLTPYIFSVSSHLSFTMTLALPLWVSYFFCGLFSDFTKTLARMVPTGTPEELIPFMIFVETVSFLIRPLTLALRLMANLVAGHLLIVLATKFASFWAIQSFLYLLPVGVLLYVLEAAVAVIQAFVFISLTSLYIDETIFTESKQDV